MKRMKRIAVSSPAVKGGHEAARKPGDGDACVAEGPPRPSFGLPPDLRAALDRLAHGRSRKALGDRAAAQSRFYRAGGGSIVATEEDALAYAFTRLPATYAAAAAVFQRLRETAAEFRPRTLFDVGAGPGTASIAAVQAFASLGDLQLMDRNEQFRALARRLMTEAGDEALRRACYRQGDALALLATATAHPADLVVASYVGGEMPQAEMPGFAKALWAATAEKLVIIEPGTPSGYRRVMAIRNELIAIGAHVAAPCPHELACPLQGADWCHFAQRLPRSRDHLAVKRASVPYEDEKFSYMVFSRSLPRRPDARVLAQPEITKGTAGAKLCTRDGLIRETISRRDAEAYRRRKAWRWGDGVTR
jgi:ribosomal protein RSM22 (predicted rRNA methylase)